MADILDFKRSTTRAKAMRKRQAQGKTLCKKGFHKWQIDKRKQFDVKRGKLVTVRQCERCGARKTTLD